MNAPTRESLAGIDLLALRDIARHPVAAPQMVHRHIVRDGEQIGARVVGRGVHVQLAFGNAQPGVMRQAARLLDIARAPGDVTDQLRIVGFEGGKQGVGGGGRMHGGRLWPSLRIVLIDDAGQAMPADVQRCRSPALSGW